MAHSVLGIDTGGTFTDLVLVADGKITVHKVLSTPDDPSRAALDGRRGIDADAVAPVVHGTTVATNALLERKGARTVLVTTAGFEDVVEIGRQARSRLYDLEYRAPVPLVASGDRIGVAERIGSAGDVVEPLTSEAVDAVVQALTALEPEAAAVCLLYSFLHPSHEAALREAIAKALPNLFLTASSDLLPEFREFERTSTTVVNAYVGPLMSRYLERMQQALGGSLRVMQSSGGSVTADLAAREPVRTVLSGPAGGVIGASYVASLAGYDNIITFDMGGTSTDVALCPGRVLTATDFSVDGMPIGVPVIDIHTVGAGGGSIARIDEGGALRVGPESAGANPGPACYGKGTEPTVTDANLVLGRVDASRFLGGRMTVDAGRASTALREALAVGDDVHEVALGVVRVANAVMERALRTVSLERGYDPREFALVPFGGAGPQHACELAEALGMSTVLIPRYPGVLSALGVAIADVSKDYSRTVMAGDAQAVAGLDSAFAELEAHAVSDLSEEGFDRGAIELVRSVDVRYRGQSFDLRVDWPAAGTYDSIADTFGKAHEARFGYAHAAAPVEVVNVRVQARVAAQTPGLEVEEPRPGKPTATGEADVWFEVGAVATGVFERESLHAGDSFSGPALVTQMDATTVVPPGWGVRVDAYGNMIVERQA